MEIPSPFTFLPINPLTGSKRRREDGVKKRRGLVLGTAIFMLGGLACIAQKVPIPFERLQWNSETPQQPAEMEHANASASSFTVLSSSAVLESSTAESPVRSLGANLTAPSPRLGARFFLFNSLNIGMTALDESLSQQCIAEHRCREANPLMPSSLAGRIGVVAAFAGLGTYVSYRLKRQRSRLWWVPPVFGTAAHSVGAASGFANR